MKMPHSPQLEDAIKQLVLANADGNVKAVAYVMILEDGEPEMGLSFPGGTAYALVTGLEILKQSIINKIVSDGAVKPEDRR